MTTPVTTTPVTTTPVMTKTEIAKMEEELAALLLASETNSDSAALGKIGAYAVSAVHAGIAGNRAACEVFAKAHFAAVDAKSGRVTAASRVSEWTRAMEFGNEFEAVKIYTATTTQELRTAGVSCHIANTANGILAVFSRHKKENLPAPTPADIAAKIAARIVKAGEATAKAAAAKVKFEALTKPQQLAKKVADADRVYMLQGILESLTADGWQGVTEIHKLVPKLIAPVAPVAPVAQVAQVAQVAPVAVVTPAAVGDADLAGIMETRMDAKFDALAAMLVEQLSK